MARMSAISLAEGGSASRRAAKLEIHSLTVTEPPYVVGPERSG
jgi:hypothetical protein